ncbi:MAG: phosphotransferase [Acidobacteriales bacterium]|nr:phosphotransferase [Terriglobales bacterium]
MKKRNFTPLAKLSPSPILSSFDLSPVVRVPAQTTPGNAPQDEGLDSDVFLSRFVEMSFHAAHVESSRTLPAPQLSALQRNIAAALDATPDDVTVDRWGMSPRLRSIHCWGRCRGESIFARTLIRDPYLLSPPVTTPWDDTMPFSSRPAEEQIQVEWNTLQDVRRITGTDHIADPLGKSLSHRTIVLRDVKGEIVDEMVKRRKWFDSKAAAVSALLEAGAWLRSLHDRSASKSLRLSLYPLLQAFRERVSGGRALRPNEQRALRTLELTEMELGDTEFSVPAALSHGDFTLANLRWHEGERRVFVADFENVVSANICQDLLSLISDLRSQLLNPIIPKDLILSLEKAFWEGYGPVAKPVLAYVNGVASARVFYHHLPMALTRRKRRGGMAKAAASVYQAFLQSLMMARCTEGL